MNPISLEGKVALVTGGGGGIGRGIAESFAELGARVLVADSNPESVARVNEESEPRAGSIDAIECDVRDTAAVRALMQRVETREGRLDVLVNNVGHTLRLFKPLEEMSDENIDDLFGILLRHVMICSREAIPLLKRSGDGGSIISISSIEGYRGLPNLVPYAAFKLGIEGFTKSLALELGPYGIRVNGIAPETTESESIRPSRWVKPERSSWRVPSRNGSRERLFIAMAEASRRRAGIAWPTIAGPIHRSSRGAVSENPRRGRPAAVAPALARHSPPEWRRSRLLRSHAIQSPAINICRGTSRGKAHAPDRFVWTLRGEHAMTSGPGMFSNGSLPTSPSGQPPAAISSIDTVGFPRPVPVRYITITVASTAQSRKPRPRTTSAALLNCPPASSKTAPSDTETRAAFRATLVGVAIGFISEVRPPGSQNVSGLPSV